MKQHGFVLIELLIITVIIGIMASIIMLQLNSFMIKQDIDNAAKELVGDLRWIQQLSINSGVGPFHWIKFNNAEPYGYSISLNANDVKRVTFPQNVRINYPIPRRLCFGMNGYVYPSGETIYLQYGREFRHIIIDSVGRVRIYNPNMHREGNSL